MKKHILVVLLLLAVLGLFACEPADQRETEQSLDTTIEETVTAPTASVPETTEETILQTQEQPSQGQEQPMPMTQDNRRLSEDEVALYGAYFDEYGTWYTQALTSEYDSPKSMNLMELFYNGILTGDEESLTDEERAYLEGQSGYYGELDTSRLPKAKMDQVLKQYFGIGLEETDQVGLQYLPYWEETDSYYISRGDTNATKAQVYAGIRRSNGDVVLFYEHRSLPGEYYMITVKPIEDGILVAAHQKMTYAQ